MRSTHSECPNPRSLMNFRSAAIGFLKSQGLSREQSSTVDHQGVHTEGRCPSVVVIHMRVPTDFQDSAIAGKEASFSVHVKEIKQRILPDLDDEFARGLPENYEDLDALKQAVEEALKSEGENSDNRKYEDAVVAALLDGATFELSPLMVEHEIKHIEEDQDKLLQRLKIRKDDYLRSIGKTQEERREEAREQAEQRLRRTFAINKIAELEAVETADDEVNERLEQAQAAAQQAQQPQPNQGAEDQRASVERMLSFEKTVKLLVDIAKGQAAPVTRPVMGEPRSP